MLCCLVATTSTLDGIHFTQVRAHLGILLSHGKPLLGASGLGLLRHRHPALLLLPVDAVGHTERILPLLDGRRRCGAGTRGEAPTRGIHVPGEGQAAGSSWGWEPAGEAGYRGDGEVLLLLGRGGRKNSRWASAMPRETSRTTILACMRRFTLLTPRDRQGPSPPPNAAQGSAP